MALPAPFIRIPRYRYRVLVGSIREAVYTGIQAICGHTGCEVAELNVPKDHVHLIAMIPPTLEVLLELLMDRVSIKLSAKREVSKRKTK